MFGLLGLSIVISVIIGVTIGCLRDEDEENNNNNTNNSITIETKEATITASFSSEEEVLEAFKKINDDLASEREFIVFNDNLIIPKNTIISVYLEK